MITAVEQENILQRLRSGGLIRLNDSQYCEINEVIGRTLKLSQQLNTATDISSIVFINHACSFLDMGGITLEDDVLIGPKVNLITENHPLDPSDRKALMTKPIVIKCNAWIGAGATILPGVTIGENSVVAAGAVVSKNVPANTVVRGIPAKIIKTIDS
jgi:acetyltransferase-like isoleucine patch superfamily enzyme